MLEVRHLTAETLKSVLRNILSSSKDVRRAQMNSNKADSN